MTSLVLYGRNKANIDIKRCKYCIYIYNLAIYVPSHCLYMLII